MTAKPKINSDGRTITVRVPIAIRKRGGGKVVLAPGGAPNGAVFMCQRADNAIIKAVARAFRWREMLESGKHATITDLAQAERIDHSYVGRILRLTLLAPNLVEAITSGRQSGSVTLASLSKAFPVDWGKQTAKFR